MAEATLYRSIFNSPLGPLTLLLSPRGARAIHFGCLPAPPGSVESLAHTRALSRQLEEYFRRQRRAFDIALDPSGTLFQHRVWSALLQIPYGSTTNYAAIARAIGQSGAAQAVGQANRRNPLPILVPCHRVIASDGTLGGYSGGSPAGLKMKACLLALEK